MNREITSYEELERLVLKLGFLPFFKNSIQGFSVEEHTPPELWFPDDEDEEGPWEWKGPVARGGKCVYGKLFQGKAGFVSLEWFPDLANFRRDGYDFDARYEDGLASRKDKQLYDALAREGSLLTKELKTVCGYGKGGQKGFDTVITRLQMQTYVNVENFEYLVDRFGNLYGWGVARYTTPETQFGPEAVTAAYHRAPEESGARIQAYLQKLLPKASEKQIAQIIGAGR